MASIPGVQCLTVSSVFRSEVEVALTLASILPALAAKSPELNRPLCVKTHDSYSLFLTAAESLSVVSIDGDRSDALCAPVCARGLGRMGDGNSRFTILKTVIARLGAAATSGTASFAGNVSRTWGRPLRHASMI
jgi:hypothetical protein